jgi:hypothetical protein
MQILLKFYIKRKSSCDRRLLFWSCVLNSEINKTKVDFNYLNRGNTYSIDEMSEFELCINYCQFGAEIIEQNYNDYKNRPVFFLTTDKTWLARSPYNHSSFSVETHYVGTIEFIQKIKTNLILIVIARQIN